jgi:hypothetical protein
MLSPPFLVLLASGLVALEWLVIAVRFEWLARLAFIPMGIERRVALTPGLVDALEREVSARDYREPVRHDLDLGRIDGVLGKRFGFLGGEVRVARGGSLFLVMDGKVLYPRIVARVTLRRASGRILLRGRFLPIPSLWIAMVAAFLLSEGATLSGLGFVIVLWIVYAFFCWAVTLRRAASALEALETQLTADAAEGPLLRFLLGRR